MELGLQAGAICFGFSNKRRMCIMLGAELVVTATLCFASADSYMSINSSYVEDNPERSGFWCVAKA